jgi:HNH endonuclease
MDSKEKIMKFTITERIVASFRKRCIPQSNGCILYTGAVQDEYGYVSCYREDGSRTKMGVHRLAYYLEHGELDDNLHIRHKCDTPLCVNPNHLESGTPTDNVYDSLKRGRRHTAL